MRAWITILRPLNLLQAALAVVLAMAVLESLHQAGVLLMLVVSVMLINGAGNVINDIMDLEIDRINRPKRPLPSGGLSLAQAWVYTVVLFATGIILAAFINLSSLFIAAIIALPLLVGYSLLFKRLALIGNLVVSLMLGMAFIYVGAALGRIPDMLTIAGLAFGFTLIREIVKDLEDMEGDRQEGARTLPLVWGEKKTLLFTVALILLFSLLDLLPHTLGIYDRDYLWWVLLAVNLPLWACAVWLLRRPQHATYARVQLILKLDIFAGLAAIYWGTV